MNMITLTQLLVCQIRKQSYLCWKLLLIIVPQLQLETCFGTGPDQEIWLYNPALEEVQVLQNGGVHLMLAGIQEHLISVNVSHIG